MPVVIDLSLSNTDVYKDCVVESVGGRLNLKTPPEEAADIVGRNLAALIKGAAERDTVTLTGPMAVWVYLIAFHHVVHLFRHVYYEDGRGLTLLVAAHG